MTLIDLAAFKVDYHNPELRAADVAQRYGVAEGSLAEFAKAHGIPSRKAMGIKARAKREPKGEGIGSGGCRPCCPGWAECRRHMGREKVPCEVVSFWDEDRAVIDLEPVYGGGAALGVRLYFLEDAL